MSKYHKAAWDEESKQRQREVIMKRKPWLRSTGAKTVEGKERLKMNALKADIGFHLLIKEYKHLMIQQKAILDIVQK